MKMVISSNYSDEIKGLGNCLFGNYKRQNEPSIDIDAEVIIQRLHSK